MQKKSKESNSGIALEFRVAGIVFRAVAGERQANGRYYTGIEVEDASQPGVFRHVHGSAVGHALAGDAIARARSLHRRQGRYFIEDVLALRGVPPPFDHRYFEMRWSIRKIGTLLFRVPNVFAIDGRERFGEVEHALQWMREEAEAAAAELVIEGHGPVELVEEAEVNRLRYRS